MEVSDASCVGVEHLKCSPENFPERSQRVNSTENQWFWKMGHIRLIFRGELAISFREFILLTFYALQIQSYSQMMRDECPITSETELPRLFDLMDAASSAAYI